MLATTQTKASLISILSFECDHVSGFPADYCLWVNPQACQTAGTEAHLDTFKAAQQSSPQDNNPPKMPSSVLHPVQEIFHAYQQPSRLSFVSPE
jgi:hypothetical protein